MIITKKIFDSYTLNRMITEFSWTNPGNGSGDTSNSEYVMQNYRDIFLNPEFIRKKANNASFVEIDIGKIYNSFIKTFGTKSQGDSTTSPLNPNPKSMDYVDDRLFSTPENILQHVLDEEKLTHTCLVHLGSDHILFDCNFEQLTLILGILEKTFEHNPLHDNRNEFNYSTMNMIPNFNTHSFVFTFNLTRAIPQTFDTPDIHDKLCRSLLPLSSDVMNVSEFSPLLGYTGIFISLTQIDDNDELIVFHVSNEFTRSSILFDTTGIQKTSLLLLDYVFKLLIQDDYQQFKNLNKIRTGLKIYID